MSRRSSDFKSFAAASTAGPRARTAATAAIPSARASPQRFIERDGTGVFYEGEGLHVAAAFERAPERDFVGVLQIAADRSGEFTVDEVMALGEIGLIFWRYRTGPATTRGPPSSPM